MTSVLIFARLALAAAGDVLDARLAALEAQVHALAVGEDSVTQSTALQGKHVFFDIDGNMFRSGTMNVASPAVMAKYEAKLSAADKLDLVTWKGGERLRVMKKGLCKLVKLLHTQGAHLYIVTTGKSCMTGLFAAVEKKCGVEFSRRVAPDGKKRCFHWKNKTYKDPAQLFFDEFKNSRDEARRAIATTLKVDGLRKISVLLDDSLYKITSTHGIWVPKSKPNVPTNPVADGGSGKLTESNAEEKAETINLDPVDIYNLAQPLLESPENWARPVAMDNMQLGNLWDGSLVITYLMNLMKRPSFQKGLKSAQILDPKFEEKLNAAGKPEAIFQLIAGLNDGDKFIDFDNRRVGSALKAQFGKSGLDLSTSGGTFTENGPLLDWFKKASIMYLSQ